MTDYFALLGQARRPWLEPASLRERFVSLSATLHPDRVHGEDDATRRAAQDGYTALNAAYQCLREPKDRLRHLLALERGGPPEELQRVEPELMDLFAGVSQASRRADAILQAKPSNSSPLLQVQWFEQAQECRDRLGEAGRELAGRVEKLDADLRQLDAAWAEATQAGRAGLLERLESIYRLYGFLNRWNGQVQSRVLQLSL